MQLSSGKRLVVIISSWILLMIVAFAVTYGFDLQRPWTIIVTGVCSLIGIIMGYDTVNSVENSK